MVGYGWVGCTDPGGSNLEDDAIVDEHCRRFVYIPHLDEKEPRTLVDSCEDRWPTANRAGGGEGEGRGAERLEHFAGGVKGRARAWGGWGVAVRHRALGIGRGAWG